MRRSVHRAIAVSALLVLAGCASKTPPPPVVPLWTPRGANFATAAGVPVFGRIAMPPGFTPLPPWPALWLLRGTEVAVVGKQGDRTVVIGFSGAHFEKSRLLATDYGLLAPRGTLMDLAVSPDGYALAAAVSEPEDNRLELVARRLVGEDPGAVVATFEGRFATASLAWLDSNTMGLALRRAAETNYPPDSAPGSSKTGELHIVSTGGRELTSRVQLGCEFSRLIWSPDARFAFVEGASGAAPLMISREGGPKCEAIQAPANIRFLGWAPGANRFLYFGAMAGATGAGGFGVFEYDLTTGASRLIALSSAAAAYTKTGEIAVLGNRNLTWRLLATRPNTSIIAEVALVNTQTSEKRINSLGITTNAGMLADSAASYSPAADTVAIEMPVPGPPTNNLLLLYFTIPARTAGPLANGTAGGLAPMSWAPAGDLLAVLDSDSSPPSLTILAPPPS